MRTVHQSVRLSPAQFHSLIALADQRQSSRYRVLADIIAAGFEAIAEGGAAPVQLADIAEELASISVRLVELERIVDRVLYTSVSGYVFARNGALNRSVGDQTAAAEIQEAYDRQRTIAGDALQ